MFHVKHFQGGAVIMKIIRLLSLTPLILILTSCVGEEPNDIAYITAVGIDKSESGFTYTMQFANPTKISGGASEEGGKGGEIVENISVEAPSLYSAINNANSIVSKNMSLSHAKVFVVSEEIASNGLNMLNDTISRNNDIRSDVFIAVAENAGEYMDEVKPAIEINPVKYYQLIYENKSGSTVPMNTAFDFYSACISGDEDCVISLAGVVEGDEQEEGGSNSNGEQSSGSKSIENKSNKDAQNIQTGFESKTKNYLAGQAGSKVKNKSETLGMSVFKGDRYITKLGVKDTELYNILTGKFREDNITFNVKEMSEYPITVQLEEKKEPKYVINKDKKNADIYLNLECELLASEDAYVSINETNKLLSEMVNEAAEQLINKLYRQYHVDSLGLRRKLKRKFITESAYGKYCESFNPAEWNIKVHTDLRIKRTGMTYYN